MVWVYNSPLTEKEQKAYDVLKNRFGESKLAKDTVKIISLVSEVKSKKFETAKEIQDHFFFDSDQKVPIFTKQTAEKLVSALKPRGGANTTYPFINYSAKQGLNKLADVLPEFIVGPVERMYELLTNPILAVKERIPLVDLSISAANGVAETGITAIGDIAKTFGGPVGAMIAIPIVALAASIAATISIVQQDLGQAIIFMVTAIPFVGTIMVKLMDKIERQVAKIKKYPELAAYVPFLRDFINEERAAKGLPPVEPLDPMAAIQNAVESNPAFQQAKQAVKNNPNVQRLQKANQQFQQANQQFQTMNQQFQQAKQAVGGKRFSTRKHSTNKKWQKTRRTKSAKR